MEVVSSRRSPLKRSLLKSMYTILELYGLLMLFQGLQPRLLVEVLDSLWPIEEQQLQQLQALAYYFSVREG